MFYFIYFIFKQLIKSVCYKDYFQRSELSVNSHTFVSRIDNIRDTVLALSKESTQNISNHRKTKLTLKELEQYVKSVGEKVNLMLKKEEFSRRHDSAALNDHRESSVADSPGYIRSPQEASHHFKFQGQVPGQDPLHEMLSKRSSRDKTSNLLRAALLPTGSIDVARSKEDGIEEVRNFVFIKFYSALFPVDHASFTK